MIAPIIVIHTWCVAFALSFKGKLSCLYSGYLTVLNVTCIYRRIFQIYCQKTTCNAFCFQTTFGGLTVDKIPRIHCKCCSDMRAPSYSQTHADVSPYKCTTTILHDARFKYKTNFLCYWVGPDYQYVSNI